MEQGTRAHGLKESQAPSLSGLDREEEGRNNKMMVNHPVVLSRRGVVALCVLVFIAGCGEPMQFENAGSKHALAEDQRACDLELQSPTGVQYVEEAKGLVDPWQVCIERKGWTRADRPVSPSSGAKL